MKKMKPPPARPPANTLRRSLWRAGRLGVSLDNPTSFRAGVGLRYEAALPSLRSGGASSSGTEARGIRLAAVVIKKFLEKNKLYLAIFLGILFFVDIFIVKFVNDLFFLFLLFFWWLLVWLYKLEGFVVIIMSLVLVCFAPLLMIFKVMYPAEKLAIWAYAFFATEVFRRIIARLRKP